MKLLGTVLSCQGIEKYDPGQDLLLDCDAFEDGARFVTWRTRGQFLPAGCKVLAVCVASDKGHHALYDLPVSQEIAAYVDEVCEAMALGRQYGHTEAYRCFSEPADADELEVRISIADADELEVRISLLEIPEPDDSRMYASDEDVLELADPDIRVA